MSGFLWSQATGYAIQHIWCLAQVRINWEDCSRKGRASRVKIGNGGGGSLNSPDGVVPSRIDGVSASDIFPCSIKSRGRFLLAPAHQGSPGKRTIKQLVHVCISLTLLGLVFPISQLKKDCDLEVWLTTLTYKLELDRVKLNHTKYLGHRSFHLTVIIETQI